jgi:hypothetical protein
MQRACIPLQPVGSTQVEAAFDAPRLSSLGGLLLVRELAEHLAFFEQVADCFVDHRDPERIEHSVRDLVAQRILGLVAGYEDLNDHDWLRLDPVFALCVGKPEPSGHARKRTRDQGRALAGHATLGRLETTPHELDAQRPDLKLVHVPERFERLLVDLFLDSYAQPPELLTLDVDATHDPIHGKQEGRFFHGFYDCYCYLPLYVFCGEDLLLAKLRPANIDGAAGALEALQQIIAQIRKRWPSVRIRVRGDSGFCRDALLTWCENNEVDYLIGLARNGRLQQMIAGELEGVWRAAQGESRPVRTFCELDYQTRSSWSCSRRVLAKAEALPGKLNPRFVVTSLQGGKAQQLYEGEYCARAEMENRIKEQHLGLFADRTSSHTLRANQLRLWFSALGYVLLRQFRRFALAGTQMARAQAWIIRQRLLKAGAFVVQTARRYTVRLASSASYRALWQQVLANLQASFVTVV